MRTLVIIVSVLVANVLAQDPGEPGGQPKTGDETTGVSPQAWAARAEVERARRELREAERRWKAIDGGLRATEWAAREREQVAVVGKLEEELARLRTKYSHSHPSCVAANSKLESERDRLATIRSMGQTQAVVHSYVSEFVQGQATTTDELQSALMRATGEDRVRLLLRLAEMRLQQGRFADAEPLLREVAAGEGPVAAWADEHLGTLESTPASGDVLAGLLARLDGDPETASDAYDVLCKLGGLVVPAVLARLDDLSPRGRALAYCFLCRHPSPAVIEAMARGLQTKESLPARMEASAEHPPDLMAQLAVAQALSQLPVPLAAPLVARAAQSPHAEVRLYAALSLSRDSRARDEAVRLFESVVDGVGSPGLQLMVDALAGPVFHDHEPAGSLLASLASQPPPVDWKKALSAWVEHAGHDAARASALLPALPTPERRDELLTLLRTSVKGDVTALAAQGLSEDVGHRGAEVAITWIGARQIVALSEDVGRFLDRTTPSLKIRVLSALKGLPLPWKAVMPLLDEGNVDVRGAAVKWFLARVLAGDGAEDGIRALATRFLSPKKSEAETELMTALIPRLGPEDRQRLPALVTADRPLWFQNGAWSGIRNIPSTLRRDVLAAILAQDPHDLQPFLSDPVVQEDPDLRGKVLAHLTPGRTLPSIYGFLLGLPDESLTPFVLDALDKASHDPRAAASSTFLQTLLDVARARHITTVPLATLRKLLVHPQPRIRLYCVRLLQSLRTTDAVPALLDALGDDTEEVWSAAQTALDRIRATTEARVEWEKRLQGVGTPPPTEGK